MPLDLGWYYIYDPALAFDQFEYVLGKSLGFGCSISLQTSPAMLRTYPRMAEILDLVAAYEKARLTHAFPEEARAKPPCADSSRVAGESKLLGQPYGGLVRLSCDVPQRRVRVGEVPLDDPNDR